MSDGGREHGELGSRPLDGKPRRVAATEVGSEGVTARRLGVNVWKSSQKCSAERSAVRFDRIVRCLRGFIERVSKCSPRYQPSVHRKAYHLASSCKRFDL